jgi:hypothetical protein
LVLDQDLDRAQQQATTIFLALIKGIDYDNRVLGSRVRGNVSEDRPECCKRLHCVLPMHIVDLPNMSNQGLVPANELEDEANQNTVCVLLVADLVVAEEDANVVRRQRFRG